MQTAQINIKVDGQQANNSVNQLNENLNKTSTNTSSLRKQLREVTQELQNLEPGSKRFQELSERAGQLRDTIQDTSAVIKATAGSPIENLGKGLQGVASIGIAGFQGIASAQALFGVESKELERTLVKLQALAGLSQAVESLGGLKDTVTNIRVGFTTFGKAAVASLQGIKGAIAATGIGLLLVAVGTLVAYWDDIKEAITGVSREQKKLLDDADKRVESETQNLKQLELQEKQMRLRGVSEKEILQYKILQNQQAINAVKNQIVLNEGLLDSQNIYNANIDRYKILLGFGNAATQQLLGFFETDTKQTEDKINAQKEALNQLIINQLDYEIQIKDIETKAQEDKNKINEDNIKKDKEQKEDRLNTQRLLEDAELRLMKDGLQKRLKENEIYYQRLIQDTKRNEKIKETEKQKLINTYQKEKEKKDNEILEKDWQIKRDAELKSQQELIDLMEDGTDKKVAQINLDFDRQEFEILKRYEGIKKTIVDGQEVFQIPSWTSDMGVSIDEYEDNLKKLELIDKKRRDELLKFGIETREKSLKNFTEGQRKLMDFELSIMEDGIEKQRALRERQFQDERDELDELLKDKIITQEKYNELLLKLEIKFQEDIAEIQKKGNEEKIQETARLFERQVQLFGTAIMDLAQSVSALFDEINQQALDRISYQYDAEVEKVNQLRDAKILSEEQFNNKKVELDQQRAVDERKIKQQQFNREKALNIAQAIMSGALAVLQALSAAPPPANFVLAGIAGVAASVQIAAIASQQFRAAKGGIVPANGLPGDVDSVNAKLAPGEAVINSRSTAMFPNILSLINQAGGGQPLVPDMMQQGSSGGGIIFGENQPQTIRAYVVETEISDTQRKVGRIQRAVEF